MRMSDVRFLSLSAHVVGVVLGIACFVWLGAVNAAYLATLDQGRFVDELGRPYAAYFWPQLFVPCTFWALWQSRAWPRLVPLLGFLGGLTVAIWFNVLLLTLPYAGMYPSLPAAMLVWTLSGQRGVDAGAWFFVPIMAVNVLIWSTVGFAIGGLASTPDRRTFDETLADELFDNEVRPG
jgi:hypothetical protein